MPVYKGNLWTLQWNLQVFDPPKTTGRCFMTQNGPGTTVFDDELMIQSEQLNIPNLHCSCLAGNVSGKAVNLGESCGRCRGQWARFFWRIGMGGVLNVCIVTCLKLTWQLETLTMMVSKLGISKLPRVAPIFRGKLGLLLLVSGRGVYQYLFSICLRSNRSTPHEVTYPRSQNWPLWSRWFSKVGSVQWDMWSLPAW